MRKPGTVNFIAELAAVALLVILELVTKVVNSALVGTLKPTGQGLFALASVAHKASFCKVLQSLEPIINDALAGLLLCDPVVLFTAVPVVPFVHVINSCPSGFLPHWNELP